MVSAKECISALGKRGSCEGKVALDAILKLDMTGSTDGWGVRCKDKKRIRVILLLVQTVRKTQLEVSMKQNREGCMRNKVVFC